MNRSTILSAVIGLIALLTVGALAVGMMRYRRLVDALPPKIVCSSQADAFAQTGFAGIGILGTGSMQPYIRAARIGEDPRKIIVAYAMADSKPFKAISKGDLVVYQPTWAKRYVIHQAAKKQDDKWIMSGLHNRESEWFEPIGQDKFVCIIETVYVWNP